MGFDKFTEALKNREWSSEDLRSNKKDLFLAVQRAVDSFVPLKQEDTSGNPIQLIDFFCGAGGTSLGFAALNTIAPTFNLLGGCDINAISAATYSHNYGTPLFHDDVTKLANEDGVLEAALERLHYDATKPTVLIGCAPCQGFSSHRKKHWNEEDDLRNSLIISFARIVERIQPVAIIMENVPEFLSKRYWRYFSAARKLFEENGYVVKQNIYNAATFGVPQERFRSIVIGMKKDFVLPSGYLESGQYRTVRDAIGKLPEVKAGVAASDDPMHKSAAHRRYGNSLSPRQK